MPPKQSCAAGDRGARPPGSRWAPWPLMPRGPGAGSPIPRAASRQWDDKARVLGVPTSIVPRRPAVVDATGPDRRSTVSSSRTAGEAGLRSGTAGRQAEHCCVGQPSISWGLPPAPRRSKRSYADGSVKHLNGSSTDCWLRRDTASAGDGTGWTSSDTPTPTAWTTTSPTPTPGGIATT